MGIVFVAKAIGKGEFKRLLGETQTDPFRNYPKVNAAFERLESPIGDL